MKSKSSDKLLDDPEVDTVYGNTACQLQGLLAYSLALVGLRAHVAQVVSS
jgi:hypothetical protein